MKVTFKTGSEANYGNTLGELFFASNTKQIMLNGIKYIPKKLSELTNDSGFISSITKSMVEGVLTGNITSHTHDYLPLSGGTLTGNLTCNGSYITDESGGAGAKGYSGYFNNPKRSDRASYSHILGDGYAYGTNSISIGAGAYAGIRNTDSDSDTYPYLHWQWMGCLQVKEVTSAGDVNCYGAILNNLGGTKVTAKFTVCVDGVCKFYDESKGDNDPTNQFLKFTNTDANYGRVVVFVVDTGYLIFGGTTERSRSMCDLRIGNMLFGTRCRVKNIASATINGKTVYRLAIDWWSGTLSASYDITKATAAMVCTKVNNDNYSGAYSIASGVSSIASGAYSIASGSSSIASGSSSIASGSSSIASGSSSIASGSSSIASGAYSIASGVSSIASGAYSIASGSSSVASGNYSIASGVSSVASGAYSIASGYSSVASGSYSVASGSYSVASGSYSVASGGYSVASGYSSVASGSYSVASGGYSVASGYSSVASGYSSVASGGYSVAKHQGSKVYALRGISGANYQTVLGRDNVETSGAVVVGWGSSDTSRKNIFVLDTTGNATFGSGGAGTVTAATFNGSLNGTATNASKISSHSVTDLVYRTIYPINATGVLIETDIAAASNTMVNVHIWGNSYSKTTPIDTYIQFYNYKDNDDIINYGCTHLGYNFGDVYVFIYKSLVHIWFDVSGTNYPTINAFVGINEGGGVSGTYNHITSITKNSKPASDYISRERVITPKINAFTDSNVASASKLATARKITIGSTYKSFDGSGDIEFTLNSIITQSDTINVGTPNVASDATINGALTVSGDISGELSNKLSITLGSTTTTYDNTDNKSIDITPSTIGAAEASHTHNYIVTEGDNRSVATTPNDYSNKFVFKGLKYNSNIGNPSGDTYSYILGLRGWSDSSGGQSHELAFNNSGVYRRQGATTEWGSWYKILDSGNFNSYAATKDHTHTFASLESKPATLGGYGITDAYTKTETNTELGKYLPLTGGTLEGNLTVPKLTSTGGIVLGVESINGSLGIKKYNEGFIGFSEITGGINGSAPFTGISLGWGSSPETSANSVRINENTFTYKGNNVWHSGNLKLGYISSGLSRAVQKDASGNLFIVAPSLFEQGISNNYPKNLRWSNETEGQLVYDTEETAGSITTVEVSIPVANGTSKGFLKSKSTVTNVTGYTPCPVVSGTPYYKLDAIELDYTDFLEIGSGSIESHLPITVEVQSGGSLAYLFDYTVNNIPRLLTISAGNFCKYFFWLQQTDDDTPIVAYYHCQFNDLWLVIDSPNTEVRISQGSF